MIEKQNLKHGAYYKGVCKNAEVARWNSTKGVFVLWGKNKLESCSHPQDDIDDVFRPDFELLVAIEEIPI